MIVRNWWWVLTFAIVSFGLYEQAAMKLEREISSLDKEIASLETRIVDASHTQSYLKLQQESFNDPAWVELTLMRCLGMVPEGYTKIYYKETER
ncbi:MAG: hypothetical protein JSR37_01500 [Verrucomicrobia bacterium]|nr:hypothetical protein [Verrucomicrobiota bacterium]MBS0636636.1 hypothetical protein [Verrucomicrobiota bacterium]